MNLPVEIIKAVQQQQCVLFAGPGFMRESIAALGKVVPDDLSLAKSLGWTRPKRLMGTRKRRENPDPALSAEALIAKEGRSVVLDILKRDLFLDSVSPTKAHQVGLRHFPLIISTSPDDLWVDAISQENAEFQIRSRGDDMRDIQVETPMLYQLFGRYSQGSSAVVGTGSQPLPAPVTKQLKNLLRRRVIFFVGYRPDEAHFEHLWQFLSAVYGGELPRCHLAVAQGRIDDYLWQKWVWRGLLMFTADPTDCFEVLEKRLNDA